MRDQQKDQEYLRNILKKSGISEVIYVTENTYDGGYEVRCGTLDFFVDYETIDDGDVQAVLRHIVGSGLIIDEK
ncbi:MAG: hypothetical protein NUV56_00125 [Candidatus Uhrbacteria bacterium]|nr:hypothetical protein [Candidatus Uhrbacteria bacterium]